MKKNIVYTCLIIAIVLAIILFVTIIVLANSNTKERNNIVQSNYVDTVTDSESNEDKEENKYEEDQFAITLDTSINKVHGEANFVTIEQCINKYYKAVEDLDNQKITDLLSETYKTNNSNIESLTQGFEQFRIKEIYCKELDFTKKEYYVFGNLLWKNYSGMSTILVIVNVDTTNNTFSITPTNIDITNEAEYNNILNQLSKQSQSNSIVKNNNNTYTKITMTTAEIIQYYLKDYTIMAVYYPEIGYNLLDEDYREKKFGSLEEYKTYINKNIQKIANATIVNYGYEDKEDYLEFTIIDSYSNEYIIKRINTMEYTVISDIYTTDIDLITQKYDEGDAEEKVTINIQKIASALNNRDFKYVYSKLSNEFKETHYPNVKQLENEMNNILHGTFTITIEDISQEGNQYICEINFNGNTVNSSNIKMKMVMELKENRDFAMSFLILENE